MTLVKLKDGRDYILNERKELWRLYEYVTGGVCLDRAETADDFRNSGKAFGTFQNRMADFPAEQLVETIPGFHDTPKRYQALHEAIREDLAGRAKDVQREIDFMLEREENAGLLQKMLKAGELPLRVTHNDTKLNNVMLDEKTREPLCILDLDTVMPGLAANDFGDSIRFGASTAEEDEKDMTKVHLDLDLYRAYAEGFLHACRDRLTAAERETLPDGARIITLENAVRFLTDYLKGDTYYHIERPEHNLDRTRTQMALTEEMEKHDAIIRGMMNGI
jgi:Ser/Thr protein kinase RdoA (MazF antagonist)